MSECEKLALNPTVITNVLTLRTIADQIVQDSEYHVTERWYDEVANSLFCNYFITKVDPCCQVSAKYLVNFLKEIELVYEISLPKDQRETILQKLMQIHAAYQVCPYQRSILFDSAAYFSRNAKLQYPHFTKYIHQLLLKMERESGDPWFSQFYFSVLTVLFKEWEGLARSLDIHSAKVKIFVVSDSGEGHAAMIAELIRSHFYYRVAIEVHRGSALDFSYDESFKKYDLVVANYPIKNYSYGNLKIVDDFLTESDLSSIGSFVKNVR